MADDTITVEVEHDDQTTTQVFEGLTPWQAKDRAIEDVPFGDTIWRVGLWYGNRDDRPGHGHEDGILEVDES